MNSEQLGQVLTDTVASVLEEAIYALVDRGVDFCDDEVPVVESLVSFSGRYTGTVALEVETSGILPLVNDFLGCDPEHPLNLPNNDAIGELANIVAGRLLEAWLPPEVTYDIGIPTVTATTHGQTRLVNEPRVCVAQLRTDSGTHIAAAILLGVWS
jgi:CheY-specific phosphatase CheX